MGVLSDDFATVDLREDYANLSLPKEANSRGKHNGKTNKEKGSHGGKAAADPKRFSGDGSAPPRFRFGFPVISLFAFLLRVLGCGERSEPHLSMPSTRHGAKFMKYSHLIGYKGPLQVLLFFILYF